MTAFKVTVNGEHAATAAWPREALLILSVMAGRRLSSEPKPGEAKQFEDFLELGLSAVTGSEHLSWIDTRKLQTGDVVTPSALACAASRLGGGEVKRSGSRHEASSW